MALGEGKRCVCSNMISFLEIANRILLRADGGVDVETLGIGW